MTRTILAALAVTCASPLLAEAPGAPAITVEKPSGKVEAAGKTPDLDVAQAMKMFDRLFPAQPDPLPARLALARTTAGGILPNGTYGAMFGDVMTTVVDRMMGISSADLGIKPAGGTASTATFRDQMAKGDPHFDERARITRRVMAEELLKMSAILEPRLREGLARSIARRFDERQLGEVNAFLATDSGRAFGAQMMRMWVDPDVMRSMMQSFPEMITAMPAAMKRLEVETAHLPKPKKAAPAKERR